MREQLGFVWLGARVRGRPGRLGRRRQLVTGQWRRIWRALGLGDRCAQREPEKALPCEG